MKNKTTAILPLAVASLSMAVAAFSLGYTALVKPASTAIVTFDTVKYISAQRAVATRLIGGKEDGEAIGILARVEKGSRAIIEAKANGRQVIVKQAMVINNGVEDITDAVLAELGLPTDIPSVEPQLPERVMSRFSSTDEYVMAKTAYERVQDVKKNEAELDKKIKEEKDKAENKGIVDNFLP